MPGNSAVDNVKSLENKVLLNLKATVVRNKHNIEQNYVILETSRQLFSNKIIKVFVTANAKIVCGVEKEWNNPKWSGQASERIRR